MVSQSSEPGARVSNVRRPDPVGIWKGWFSKTEEICKVKKQGRFFLHELLQGILSEKIDLKMHPTSQAIPDYKYQENN